VTGGRILWRSPNESLLIGDYKQIQCIIYGGDTGQMFPEAKTQLYSSNLLCFQIHFKITMHYTLITKAKNKHASK